MINRKICISLLVAFILLPSWALSFDFNTCWKNDDMKYPLNVICFTDTKFEYGVYKISARYTKNNGTTFIEHMGGTVEVIDKNSNSISVTYPDPRLPKGIIYNIISLEEAQIFMTKK